MKSFRSLFAFFLVILAFSVDAHSQSSNVFKITPEHSYVFGSIRYSLIGNYKVSFDDFEGEIFYDETNTGRCFVRLEVKSASLKSKFPLLDKVVRSKRLLDAEKYPVISFKSEKVIKENDQYWVIAQVKLKGVTKRMRLPFTLHTSARGTGGVASIEAQGKWTINRKDFDFLWHPVLDKGGIIVGDYVTVDWKVDASSR